jgi:hypothetical protein
MSMNISERSWRSCTACVRYRTMTSAITASALPKLSAGDIYKVALIPMLDSDPVRAANQAASAPCKFTHPAAGHEIVYQPSLETDA